MARAKTKSTREYVQQEAQKTDAELYAEQQYEEEVHDDEFWEHMVGMAELEIANQDEAAGVFVDTYHEIETAKRNGAREDDVKDMEELNLAQYQDSRAARKREEEALLPEDKKAAEKESREILNAMQRFNARVKIANRAFEEKGLEVYSKIAEPFEKQREKRINKSIKNTTRSMMKLAHKKQREEIKIMNRAKNDMNRHIRKLIREGKDTSNVDISAFRKNTAKYEILSNRVEAKETVIGEYIYSLEELRKARLSRNEAILEKRQEIEKNREAIAYSKSLDDKERSEYRDKMKEEKEAARQEMRDLKARQKQELKEFDEENKEKKAEKDVQEDARNEKNKEEKEEEKDQSRAEKKATKAAVFLAARVAAIDLDRANIEAGRLLSELEGKMEIGQVMDLEIKDDKYKAMKDLSGKVTVAKWDAEKETFKTLSKIDTISAFAKDNGVVEKTMKEQVKGFETAEKDEKGAAEIKNDEPVR